MIYLLNMQINSQKQVRLLITNTIIVTLGNFTDSTFVHRAHLSSYANLLPTPPAAKRKRIEGSLTGFSVSTRSNTYDRSTKKECLRFTRHSL